MLIASAEGTWLPPTEEQLVERVVGGHLDLGSPAKAEAASSQELVDMIADPRYRVEAIEEAGWRRLGSAEELITAVFRETHSELDAFDEACYAGGLRSAVRKPESILELRETSFFALAAINPTNASRVLEAVSFRECPIEQMRRVIFLMWVDCEEGAATLDGLCKKDSEEPTFNCGIYGPLLLSRDTVGCGSERQIKALIRGQLNMPLDHFETVLQSDWSRRKLLPSRQNYPYWAWFSSLFAEAADSQRSPLLRDRLVSLARSYRTKEEELEELRSPEARLLQKEWFLVSNARSGRELSSLIPDLAAGPTRLNALNRLYFCCAAQYQQFFSTWLEDPDTPKKEGVIAAEALRMSGDSRGSAYLDRLKSQNDITVLDLVGRFLDPTSFEEDTGGFESPDVGERKEAARRLGKYIRLQLERIDGVDALERLEILLEDPEVEVRRAAAEAIWRSMTKGWVGLPGPSALPSVLGWNLLRQLEKDPEVELRDRYVGYVEKWQADFQYCRSMNESMAAAMLERLNSKEKGLEP